jgi:hypothetical protein
MFGGGTMGVCRRFVLPGGFPVCVVALKTTQE